MEKSNDKKNPISQLQEYCVEHNQQIPKYTITSNERSTFTCSVEVLSMHDSSDGVSKKEAKTLAAKKILQRLLDKNKTLLLPNRKHDSNNNVQQPTNSINKLQELCVKSKILTPIYEDSGKSGADHTPIFAIKCILGDHHEVGTGASKKHAKESAANKMLTLFDQLEINSLTPVNKTLFGGAIGNKENDDIDMNIIGNPRGQLQELCVDRKIMAPIIEVNSQQLISSYFQATCRVKDEQTFGIGTSKKLAIQISCQKMLNILEYKYKNEIKLNIKCIENEFPAPSDIIKVYRKHKKMNKYYGCVTDIPLSERHNYFQTISKSKKLEIIAIINSIDYSAEKKVQLIANTLNMSYKIEPGKLSTTMSTQVFILNGNYDVAIMGNHYDLYEKVLNWFKDMV